MHGFQSKQARLGTLFFQCVLNFLSDIIELLCAGTPGPFGSSALVLGMKSAFPGLGAGGSSAILPTEGDEGHEAVLGASTHLRRHLLYRLNESACLGGATQPCRASFPVCFRSGRQIAASCSSFVVNSFFCSSAWILFSFALLRQNVLADRCGQHGMPFLLRVYCLSLPRLEPFFSSTRLCLSCPTPFSSTSFPIFLASFFWHAATATTWWLNRSAAPLSAGVGGLSHFPRNFSLSDLSADLSAHIVDGDASLPLLSGLMPFPPLEGAPAVPV